MTKTERCPQDAPRLQNPIIVGAVRVTHGTQATLNEVFQPLFDPTEQKACT